MPKHTPGPWSWYDESGTDGCFPLTIKSDHDDIDIAEIEEEDRSEEEAIANAILIVASPCLLAACRRIVEALSVHHMASADPFPGDHLYAEAHQGLYNAIAEATTLPISGGSPDADRVYQMRLGLSGPDRDRCRLAAARERLSMTAWLKRVTLDAILASEMKASADAIGKRPEK